MEDFARDSKTQQLISLDGASRRSMRHWSAREAPSVEGMTPRAHPGSNPDCSFIFASRAGDKDGRQRATAAGLARPAAAGSGAARREAMVKAKSGLEPG